MKLATDKCKFGLREIQFIVNTITSEGLTNYTENYNFFEHSECRETRIFQFYKAFTPGLADELLPFYRLRKKDTGFVIEDEHHVMLEKLTNDLRTACDLSLRLPKVDQPFVIMGDASFYAAGYVLMIEDYTTNEVNQELKFYAPVSFGSRVFHPNQLKLSIYAKEFFAVHFALETFANILWGCKKPVLILTDNRSVTRLFQTKIIPPTLWNALDPHTRKS